MNSFFSYCVTVPRGSSWQTCHGLSYIDRVQPKHYIRLRRCQMVMMLCVAIVSVSYCRSDGSTYLLIGSTYFPLLKPMAIAMSAIPFEPFQLWVSARHLNTDIIFACMSLYYGTSPILERLNSRESSLYASPLHRSVCPIPIRQV